jgi:hypothetical protein
MKVQIFLLIYFSVDLKSLLMLFVTMYANANVDKKKIERNKNLLART